MLPPGTQNTMNPKNIVSAKVFTKGGFIRYFFIDALVFF